MCARDIDLNLCRYYLHNQKDFGDKIIRVGSLDKRTLLTSR